jgi:ribosome-binding protein aMBF1 (putative translation factor)
MAGSVKLTVEQCRAGRALLDWSAADLASTAGLSVITVKRFEGGQNIASSSSAKIADTLIAAGVILIEDGEASPSGRAGVRLA